MTLAREDLLAALGQGEPLLRVGLHDRDERLDVTAHLLRSELQGQNALAELGEVASAQKPGQGLSKGTQGTNTRFTTV